MHGSNRVGGSFKLPPLCFLTRAIPGHWEGDLLSGAKNSYIATVVERHSRFAMLIKVSSKDTEVVRGLEMAKHKDFTVATDVKVYSTRRSLKCGYFLRLLSAWIVATRNWQCRKLNCANLQKATRPEAR